MHLIGFKEERMKQIHRCFHLYLLLFTSEIKVPLVKAFPSSCFRFFLLASSERAGQLFSSSRFFLATRFPKQRYQVSKQDQNEKEKNPNRKRQKQRFSRAFSRNKHYKHSRNSESRVRHLSHLLCPYFLKSNLSFLVRQSVYGFKKSETLC